MSLDRRIVAVLYFNDLYDINSVENFTRINEDYYEAIVNGKLEKLKVPGKDYFVDIEELPEVKEKVKTSIKKKEAFVQKPIEEQFITVEDEIKKEPIFTKTITQFMDKEKITEIVVNEVYDEIVNKNEISFEEELEKTEKENKKFLEEIKPEKNKKNNKVSERKLKIIESKKIDDDINDFIDSI